MDNVTVPSGLRILMLSEDFNLNLYIEALPSGPQSMMFAVASNTGYCDDSERTLEIVFGFDRAISLLQLHCCSCTAALLQWHSRSCTVAVAQLQLHSCNCIVAIAQLQLHCRWPYVSNAQDLF